MNFLKVFVLLHVHKQFQITKLILTDIRLKKISTLFYPKMRPKGKNAIGFAMKTRKIQNL